VVLAVSVVYRGCAIPVAWVILPAGAKPAWRREWLRLLRWLRPAIPCGWTVIVLADRGLYAPWLFRRIVRLGWHPFLRINTGGSFRPAGVACWRPLATFVPQPGMRWRGVGLAFTHHQVACTLLARWEEGYKDPWLILTDLPPEASDAGWYGLRAWIEQGFKITKRAGWQGHRTRMHDPDRAAHRVRLGARPAGEAAPIGHLRCRRDHRSHSPDRPAPAGVHVARRGKAVLRRGREQRHSLLTRTADGRFPPVRTYFS